MIIYYAKNNMMIVLTIYSTAKLQYYNKFV